ncbi:MAG: hypothetical protein E7001_02300 [Coriobacteriaceae bacterium]|nr:hypothetical protein [Coriobacteriaceae bacterium]
MEANGRGPASFGTGQGLRAGIAGPIICDGSAWAYHATPPILRESSLSPEEVGLPRLRSNAREVDARIRERLLTDLKGVPHPVDVMVGKGVNRRPSDLVRARIVPADLDPADVMALPGGIGVLTPLAALFYMADEVPPELLALMMMEGMGIYAIHHETDRSSAALSGLLANGAISSRGQSVRADHIREFRDPEGRIASFTTRSGSEIPWELAFDRFDRPTEHWKRAPLFSLEELRLFASSHAGKRGARRFNRAVSCARDGAASVLEAKALLLLSGSTWIGGEGLPWPELNVRIDFDEQARLLAGGRYCSADQLWRERRLIVEVNGKAFHADRQGFSLQSGRTAALRSMGYEVLDINYEQISDLSKFESMVEMIARALGERLKKRTPAFLRRRERLHKILFPHGKR